MRIVSTVDEGEILVSHLRRFDKVNCEGWFGRLSFEVDVANMTIEAVNRLIDELNGVDDIICVYVSEFGTVEFDYYVTSDLLPEIRGIVDMSLRFTNGSLTYWVFNDKIHSRDW